jgi:hypothetical protein
MVRVLRRWARGSARENVIGPQLSAAPRSKPTSPPRSPKRKRQEIKHSTSSSDERRVRPFLRGEIKNNEISITAKPWVAPEEVRKEYESLRNIWFYTDTPSERRVELVRFMTDLSEGWHDRERGLVGLRRSASWRQMMEQWNQHYPKGHEWHYKDVRNFRRDASETLEALTAYEDF